MSDTKMCECGVLTEEECQCVFFDGEPWVDIDETTPIEWDSDIDWGENYETEDGVDRNGNSVV